MKAKCKTCKTCRYKDQLILEHMTFEEFIELATQRIHGGLLAGGGTEMKLQIFMWMQKAIEWNNKQPIKV